MDRCAIFIIYTFIPNNVQIKLMNHTTQLIWQSASYSHTIVGAFVGWLGEGMADWGGLELQLLYMHSTEGSTFIFYTQ